MTVTAFWNRKGGTGKTTTAGNTAAALARHGKTLLVDCDPQANLTAWLAPNAEHELADVLAGKMALRDAVTPIRDNLDVLGGFAIGGDLRAWVSTYIRQKPFAFIDLRDSATEYQHVVFDLAPGDGDIETYALAAVNHVVLVAAPELFSFDGIEAAEYTLDQVRQNLRATFTVSGLVVNRVNRAYAAHEAIVLALNRTAYSIYTIGQSTAIHDAIRGNQTLAEYDPGNRYLAEYERLAVGLI